MNDIDALVEISKYAGERFDLVQAGGGNSSVKLDDGAMLIKASGFSLSDVEKNSGYSKVNTNDIASIVNNTQLFTLKDKREREAFTASLVKQATIDQINRPSIETLLHSLMMKYTLHTHPIVVNMLVIQKNWRELLQNVFSSDEIVLVGYQTPGIELAIALHNEIKQYHAIPKIIFLQNHGLIITSNNVNEIKSLTEYVLEKIERYLKIDMSRYKIVSKISNFMRPIDDENYITYFSEDNIITNLLKTNEELFFMQPFCPDKLVYCGVSSVKISNLEDVRPIKQYIEKYFEIPKIIIYLGQLFILSKNLKKAKEIEDVLKFHIMTLVFNETNVNFLDLDEMAYLSNWEAEKFRQVL